MPGRVGQQVQDQLGEQMEALTKGEVEVVPQQMAEFTLEPHLGPAILPFQVGIQVFECAYVFVHNRGMFESVRTLRIEM